MGERTPGADGGGRTNAWCGQWWANELETVVETKTANDFSGDERDGDRQEANKLETNEWWWKRANKII